MIMIDCFEMKVFSSQLTRGMDVVNRVGKITTSKMDNWIYVYIANMHMFDFFYFMPRPT